MFDIIIQSYPHDPYLDRCLNSLFNQVDPPPFLLHVLETNPNPTLAATPGSIYTTVLAHCNYPIFTILDSRDYYTQDALQQLYTFIKYKIFALIHADAINQNNNKVISLSSLPYTEENMHSVNPIRPPVFYNRKIYDYLLGFDPNLYLPEYDMILKMWEKFPIIRMPIPILYSHSQPQFTEDEEDNLNLILYNAKIRASKMFMTSGVNIYPNVILNPIYPPSHLQNLI